MWLLRTDRAELHRFNRPEDAPGGYAILSHVWGKNEQTFEQTPKYNPDRPKVGKNLRKKASEKIRQFCILAESYGYRWAWADTCCIDKSSSAELSEGINSMWEYYAMAEVCFAYLQDVTDHGGRVDSFRYSMWYKRGWTLQELIAPGVVVFLASNWKAFGTKAELAEDLEKVTRVPKGVLTLEIPLTDISIAERMSWASNRQTTRLEDEAYCLMGIFGVNMPTLYGEGRAAFRRLQEEIMKQSPDTSLFAWGLELYFEIVSNSGDYRYRCEGHHHPSGLLAPSPSSFSFSDTVTSLDRPSYRVGFTPHPPTMVGVGTELPTFTITPYGILSRIPVIRLDDVEGPTVALLFCTLDRYDKKHQLALQLVECRDARSPLGPLYHIGMDNPSGLSHRLLVLDPNMSLRSRQNTVQWESVYLVHNTSQYRPIYQHILSNRSLSPPFRIPLYLVRELRREGWKLTLPTDVALPWTGEPLALHIILDNRDSRALSVYFGLCGRSLRKEVKGTHWVVISLFDPQSPLPPPEHDCSQDHICDWPGQAKAFELSSVDGSDWETIYNARASFTQCPNDTAGLVLSDLSLRIREELNRNRRA